MADNKTKQQTASVEPTLAVDATPPTGAATDTQTAEPIVPTIIETEEQPTEKELHAHDHGSQTLDQSHRAEQQLKNQQQEQNNREVFPKGLAQGHGKGRG